MKFLKHNDNGELRQFGHIALVCTPKVMQELLNILMKLNSSNQQPDAKVDPHDGFCHMFKSGAKLRWFGKNKYGIYCYAYNASDGLSAVEEMKVAFSLREASTHFSKMKNLMGDVYSIRGQVTQMKHSIEWVSETTKVP